jgi:bifunctional non-homologous end joining protein LigD
MMPNQTFTTLPRIEPIVPTARPLAFDDPQWLFEPKYDGFRGVVYLSRGGCTIYSKRGNRFSRFDELRRGLCAELPRIEVILDGEIIAIDDEGRMDFWSLMGGRGHLAYAAFDLLWLKGNDLRALPLIERKKRLGRSAILLTTSPMRSQLTTSPMRSQPSKSRRCRAGRR